MTHIYIMFRLFKPRVVKYEKLIKEIFCNRVNVKIINFILHQSKLHKDTIIRIILNHKSKLLHEMMKFTLSVH